MSVILCVGAVGLDIFKSALPGLASNCYNNKAKLASFLCVFVYLFATTLSLFAAFGFYSEIKDAKSGGAKAEKLQYQSLKADKTKTLADIKALGNHRPIEAIKAQISGEESKERYWSEKLSKKCTNATSNKSKSFCDNLANLRVELAKAQKSIPKILRLEKKIEKIDEKLDGIDLTVISTSNDAQVENLAKGIGVSKEEVKAALAIIFALVFELVSGLGFWIIKSGQDKEKEALKRNLVIVENEKRDAKKIAAAEKNKATSYKNNSKDVNGFNRFIATCCIASPSENDFETTANLFKAYEKFIQENKVDIPDPLNKTTFGRMMATKKYVPGRMKESEDPRKPRGFKKIRLKVQYRATPSEEKNIIQFSHMKVQSAM